MGQRMQKNWVVIMEEIYNPPASPPALFYSQLRNPCSSLGMGWWAHVEVRSKAELLCQDELVVMSWTTTVLLKTDPGQHHVAALIVTDRLFPFLRVMSITTKSIKRALYIGDCLHGPEE
jgi:hypothetical protein